MGETGTPSLRDNKCPVCGHEQPKRYKMGDPETCDHCGHITGSKVYPRKFTGKMLDWW